MTRALIEWETIVRVSTHSRLKAADLIAPVIQDGHRVFQHTAA